MITDPMPSFATEHVALYTGDCLETLRRLPSGIVHTAITSPPYLGLRDYGMDGQIGLEGSVDAYVAALVEVFQEAARVMRHDATLWLNLGDSYNGSGGSGGDYAPGGKKAGQPKFPGRKLSGLKPKDLIGVPWRVALALQAAGWFLRADVVWHKPNSNPDSATDRPSRDHEYVFLLSKSEHYHFNKANLGAFKKSVWRIPASRGGDGHFATMPVELADLCVRSACPMNGVVLDPFMGSGTTGIAALQNSRRFIGCDLNPRYTELAIKRLSGTTMGLPFF